MSVSIKFHLPTPPTEVKRKKRIKNAKIKLGSALDVNLVTSVDGVSQTSENPGTSDSQDFTGAVVRFSTEQQRSEGSAHEILPGTSSASSTTTSSQTSTSRNLCSCCQIHLDEIQCLQTKYDALELSFVKLQQEVQTWKEVTTKVLKRKRERSASSGRNRRSLIRKTSPKSPPPSPTGTVELRHSPLPPLPVENDSHDSPNSSSSDGEGSSSSRTNVTEFNCRPQPNAQQSSLDSPATSSRRSSPRNRYTVSPSPSRTRLGLIESDDTLPCRAPKTRSFTSVRRSSHSPSIRSGFASPTSTETQSELIESDRTEIVRDESNDPFPCNDTDDTSLPEHDVDSKPGVPSSSEDAVSLRDLESESDESALIRRGMRNKKRVKKRLQSKLKCGYCTHTFSYPYELERHQRVHTGEKPFACTECSDKFSQKHHLTRHKHSKHRKPYTSLAERQRRAAEAAASEENTM